MSRDEVVLSTYGKAKLSEVPTAFFISSRPSGSAKESAIDAAPRWFSETTIERKRSKSVWVVYYEANGAVDRLTIVSEAHRSDLDGTVNPSGTAAVGESLGSAEKLTSSFLKILRGNRDHGAGVSGCGRYVSDAQAGGAPGITTDELDRLAEQMIRSHGGRRRLRDIETIQKFSARRSTIKWCMAFLRSGR